VCHKPSRVNSIGVRRLVRRCGANLRGQAETPPPGRPGEGETPSLQPSISAIPIHDRDRVHGANCRRIAGVGKAWPKSSGAEPGGGQRLTRAILTHRFTQQPAEHTLDRPSAAWRPTDSGVPFPPARQSNQPDCRYRPMGLVSLQPTRRPASWPALLPAPPAGRQHRPGARQSAHRRTPHLGVAGVTRTGILWISPRIVSEAGPDELGRRV
jgi:hypothetical protein